VPIPGTSHRHRLEENAAAVSIKISADTEDALSQLFAPGAASGLRYPENHLARLGSDRNRSGCRDCAGFDGFADANWNGVWSLAEK
jgi:hypothetical protein